MILSTDSLYKYVGKAQMLEHLCQDGISRPVPTYDIYEDKMYELQTNS